MRNSFILSGLLPVSASVEKTAIDILTAIVADSTRPIKPFFHLFIIVPLEFFHRHFPAAKVFLPKGNVFPFGL